MEQAEADYIDAVLQEWAPYVIQVLHESIKNRNLVLTQDLYQSLRWELVRATAGMVAHGKLFFREHGRWKDMRTIRNGKQAPVDAIIEEFVQKVGVSNFKYIPGYKAGKTIPTDNVAMRRIAWGISRSLARKNKTTAKKWYAKRFYGTINVLIEKLMAGAQNNASKTIQESLTK